MFDLYYDTVLYEESLGRDKSGFDRYAEGRDVEARYVKGYAESKDTKEGVGTVFNYVYHLPFEVKENDRIDGRLVVKVAPSRGIGGHIHFWKVVTQ